MARGRPRRQAKNKNEPSNSDVEIIEKATPEGSDTEVS